MPGSRIFYMGINLGAFFAPLVCGYLGQNVNWHLGFARPASAWCSAWFSTCAGGRYLGDAGLHPAPAESPAAAATLRRRAVARRIDSRCVLVALRRRHVHGRPADHRHAGRRRRRLLPAVPDRRILRLAVLLRRLDAARNAHGSMRSACSSSPPALFWSVFEQAGSTLNLFADRNTQQRVPRACRFRAAGSSR